MSTDSRTSDRLRPGAPSSVQLWLRGALLLLGGVVVILVIAPVGGARLYWMPLIIGITYLVASAAGGRSGGLWVPGVLVTAWGIGTSSVLSGTIETDFAAATILAIGAGAVVATLLPRVGIACNPLAIAVTVLLIGALELVQAEVGGVLQDGWPWGALLVVGALWELRLVLPHGDSPA